MSINRPISLIGFTFIISTFLNSAVLAGIGSVGGSSVKKGALKSEFRLSYNDDNKSSLDDRVRGRLILGYGFTDHFSLSSYIQGDKRGNDDFEFDAFITDAKFKLTEPSTHGYGSAVRFRYTLKSGDKKPDLINTRFVLDVPYHLWVFRVHQIIRAEIGENRAGGIGAESRFKVTYEYSPSYRIGLESFNNFGFLNRTSTFQAQNHTLGPVLSGPLYDGFSFEGGYRYGISKAAADHTFKLFIKYKFK